MARSSKEQYNLTSEALLSAQNYVTAGTLNTAQDVLDFLRAYFAGYFKTDSHIFDMHRFFMESGGRIE